MTERDDLARDILDAAWPDGQHFVGSRVGGMLADHLIAAGWARGPEHALTDDEADLILGAGIRAHLQALADERDRLGQAIREAKAEGWREGWWMAVDAAAETNVWVQEWDDHVNPHRAALPAETEETT